VPLDVCAQSMYHAIKAVVDEVSNLSLREIHLVNIDPETTQFIQSVFLQLSSSDSSLSSENPPQKPPSAVVELQRHRSSRDQSPVNVRDKDEVHEVLDLHPENVETSALKTSPHGKDISDEEVVEDRRHLLVAAHDLQVSHDEHGEEILDQEQPEEQEIVVEEHQHQTSALKTSPHGKDISDEEVVEDRGHLLVAAQDLQVSHDEHGEEILDQEQPEEQETVVEEHQHQTSALKTSPHGKDISDEEVVEDSGHLLAAAQDLQASRDEHGEEILDQEQPEEQETVVEEHQHQTSALKTSPHGKDISDEEVVEDRGHLLAAAHDLQASRDEHDEEILDQEQPEEQETVVEDHQHLSPDVQDVVKSFDDEYTQEQKSNANSQILMDQDDETSADKLPGMKKNVLSIQEKDDQTFDAEIGEHEQKSPASQPLIDQGNTTSNNKASHTEVLNTSETDNQTLEKYSSVKDLETGEVAEYEEHLSSKPDLQQEMFMQQLNLEEYCEGAPSLHHEPTTVVPSPLPEDASQRPKNCEPSSLEHSGDDDKQFHPLPVDIADQPDQQ